MNVLDSSISVPAASELSYNAHTSAKELLLNSASFAMGNGSSAEYIYQPGVFLERFKLGELPFSCGNPSLQRIVRREIELPAIHSEYLKHQQLCRLCLQ